MKAKEQILTRSLRDTLKETMQKEIEGLPELMERLPLIERVNLICKLMPFVFPKVHSVTHNSCEPDEFKIEHYHE